MANERVELWHRAALEADLSGSEIGMLLDACSRAPELRDRLTLVLVRLAPEVSGAFLRRYVAELVQRGPKADPEASVTPALEATVVDGEAPLL